MADQRSWYESGRDVGPDERDDRRDDEHDAGGGLGAQEARSDVRGAGWAVRHRTPDVVGRECRPDFPARRDSAYGTRLRETWYAVTHLSPITRSATTAARSAGTTNVGASGGLGHEHHRGEWHAVPGAEERGDADDQEQSCRPRADEPAGGAAEERAGHHEGDEEPAGATARAVVTPVARHRNSRTSSSSQIARSGRVAHWMQS